MPHYSEFRPSPAMADRIECFWLVSQDVDGPPHRVLPDGCADLILTVAPDAVTLDAVGPMTRHQDYPVIAGRRLLGVRFRPGRWPAEHIPDTVLPLEDLWGASAKRLLDRLVHTRGPAQCARLFEAALPPDDPGPVERAVAYLEQRAGQISIDVLAREAFLSPRQFRRLCEQKTGYTPKLLARILRFRRAHTLLTAGHPAIAVALDCGYYDQSHLINELKLFGGSAASASLRSVFPSPQAPTNSSNP
jgi:AraC-like DNA-binding protein